MPKKTFVTPGGRLRRRSQPIEKVMIKPWVVIVFIIVLMAAFAFGYFYVGGR